MREVLTRIVRSSGPSGPALWPVPCAAIRARAGELDHGGDVLRGLGEDDRDGTLVDGEVPRLPCGVPAALAGQHDLPRQPIVEPLDVGSGTRVRSLAAHLSSLVGRRLET
jgi:hypothetical protein